MESASNNEQSSNDSLDVVTPDTIDVNIKESIVQNGQNNDLDPGLKVPKIDYESIGEFCFESEALALKGNNDYKNVLEAIVILEAQKEQALKDLETLQNLKDRALADPLSFVEKLKNKEDMNIPSAQSIYPVPNIEWGKYALSGDPFAFGKRQMTRIANDMKKSLKRKLKNLIDTQENDYHHWNQKEEKQLEELLIAFPPRDNSYAQWEKIANRLLNKTPSQVKAKAHSCFPLLLKNCKVGEMDENTNNEEDKEEVEVSYENSPKADEDSLDSKINISDDEEIDPELHNTAEYKLLLYKRLLKKRIKSSIMTRHLGFRCTWCKTEPIIGIRYHCMDCIPATTDFCEECVGGSYDVAQHRSDHQLEEIHHIHAGYVDRDYMHFFGNDYNYLDPNC